MLAVVGVSNHPGEHGENHRKLSNDLHARATGEDDHARTTAPDTLTYETPGVIPVKRGVIWQEIEKEREAAKRAKAAYDAEQAKIGGARS